MRYKAMPLATRHPAPDRPSGTHRPAPVRPRQEWLDWFFTMPLLLLVPAMLIPLVALAATPQLRVDGAVEPGGRVVIHGTSFPAHAKVKLLWNEKRVSWLKPVETNGKGKFVTRVELPSNLAPGTYTLTAQRRSPDQTVTSAVSTTVASVEVAVAPTTAARSPDQTPEAQTSEPSTPLADPTPEPKEILGSDPAADPTTDPTADPTTDPTADPTADPTVAPTPVPTSAPTTSPSPSVFVGYGAGSVGGRGGKVIEVTTLADSGSGSLRAALEASGARIVRFKVAGVVDLKSMINLKNPFVTIEGQSAPSPGITIKGETLFIQTHDVIIQHIRFRPGDATADSPGDLDGLTINGGSGSSTYNVVLDHIEALWGPDVGGLVIINNVSNVTVQHSILGEGLFRSRHPEAHEDADGHSLAVNIVGQSASTHPRRITLYRNLITTSQSRNPRVQGADGVDVINNVIYNFDDGPQGNPKALNLVNNVLRLGPAPAAAGLKQDLHVWRATTSSTFGTLFDGGVYVAGNVTEGFKGVLEGPTSVYAGSPKYPLSVAPETTTGLVDRVLATAGARLPTVDAVTQRLLNNVRNGTGLFLSGAGEKAPNPYWP